MTGKLILGAILGAVAIMVWGFLFWVVSPLTFNFVHSIPNEDVVIQVLNENIPRSGVYLFPFMEMENPSQDRETAEKAFLDKHLAGPSGQIFFRKEGVNPMDPMTFLFGFIHSFVSVFLIGLLLTMALPNLESYRSRMLFILLAGIFAAVSVSLSSPIWWHHPWGFHLFEAAYVAGSWLFASVVMAGIIRPRPKF